jgi:hypothetical protein
VFNGGSPMTGLARTVLMAMLSALLSAARHEEDDEE